MNETPRVLVVDDNAEAAELLQMLLETRGYEVRIANGGVAGLTEVAVFRPHVICTDIEMPGLSGSQLARALRENPYHSDTMIIAATGWSSNQLNSDVAAGDFDLHLMKPFALEDICVPIERHLSGSKARAGTSNSS